MKTTNYTKIKDLDRSFMTIGNDHSKYHSFLRDEMVHMEENLNQRINYFISVFGFILASFQFINNLMLLRIIVIIGLIIEGIFALAIGRANRRLQINVKGLELIGNDPSSDIKKVASNAPWWNLFKKSRIRLMTNILPIVIIILLILALIFSGNLNIMIHPNNVVLK